MKDNIKDMKFVEDANAGTVVIPAIEGPVKNAIIDIVPGKKVKVRHITKDLKGKAIPENTVFSISQQAKDKTVSLLGPNGLVLFVRPGNIEDII